MSAFLAVNENRYQATQRTLGALIKLNSDEENDLQNLESLSKYASSQNKLKLLGDSLRLIPQSSLVKFYFDPRFDSVLQMATSLNIVEWKKSLEQDEDINYEIIPLDKTTPISLLHHYMSAFCLEEYLKLKEDSRTILQACAYLDLACELGSYKALRVRMDNNHTILKKLISKKEASTTSEDKQETDSLTQLDLDAKRMGVLYQAVGFFHAALILLDVGNRYANAGRETQAHAFQLKAAESFLRGKELESYSKKSAGDSNIQIKKSILNDQGLKVFGIEDGENGLSKAEKYFLDFVSITPTFEAKKMDAEAAAKAREELHNGLRTKAFDEVRTWKSGQRNVKLWG